MSNEVRFTVGEDMRLTLGEDDVTIALGDEWVLTLGRRAQRAPAKEAPAPEPGTDADLVAQRLRDARAARVARRGRARSKGKRPGGVSGQAWHTSRARNKAIRDFADADPRFTKKDYLTEGGNYYPSARLLAAYAIHERGEAQPGNRAFRALAEEESRQENRPAWPARTENEA